MNKETMTKLIADYFKTQPILKAWLFGSFSQGEQCEDSDVDILVVYDKSQPIGLFKIASMNVDLDLKTFWVVRWTWLKKSRSSPG